LTRDVREQIYLPQYQQPNGAISLVIRTHADAGPLSKSVESAVAALDRGIPIFDVRAMQQSVSDALAPRRFSLLLLLIFGAVATGLAVVGLYGTIAYSVTQRTQEIGIRMALGAQPASILGMVLRQGVLIVGIGLVLGVLCALASAKVVGQFLAVSGSDPLTYVTVSLILTLVAMAACYLPARRSTKVNPIVALRHE
jgi:putative ABC transport system permease protein